MLATELCPGMCSLLSAVPPLREWERDKPLVGGARDNWPKSIVRKDLSGIFGAMSRGSNLVRRGSLGALSASVSSGSAVNTEESMVTDEATFT